MLLQSGSQLDIILGGTQIFHIWVLCKKNMRGRIVVKRSHSLRRGLAAVLASLTLIQCAPLTASAAWWPWSNETAAVEETVTLLSADVQLQNGTAIIPSDATPEEVKQALFDALVVNKEGLNPQDYDWEYYCTGKKWTGETKEGWGSIFGGSFDGGWSGDYSYPALTDNDGTYRVRIAGTTAEVTLIKASGLTSSIAVADNKTVALTYDDNGTVNYDSLRSAIFDAVVTSTTPELTVNDVTIQRQYKNTIGQDKWGELEGDDAIIGGYDPVGEGTYTLLISYAGSNGYLPTSAQVTVTFTERTAGSIVLKADQSAGVTYNEDGSINYDALRESIFKAVVESTTPDLTVNDVRIEYYAENVVLGQPGGTFAWMPLEGGKSDIREFPAMQLGNGQKVRISWDGNSSYTAASAETTVNIVEGRETPDYTLKATPDAVTLAVGTDLKVDYDALRAAIFNAVVESSDVIKAGNVTIEYYYKGITELDSKWLPLEGQAVVGGLGYPAISAGEQKVRIVYAGDQTYAPVTIETTVTVKDREQVQFNLNDGPYEVGMKFTDDQGYDYTATAAAIYEAVVDSTTPAISADQVTVEYNTDKTGMTHISYKPLDEADVTGLVKFGEGEWEIRISVPETQTYRGNSVTLKVTTTDSRLTSVVALKSGVSFTYNMDPAVMEQAIFDNLIDWDNSTLPARETLTIDNFTIEYKAKLTDAETGVDLDIDDILNKIPGLDDIISSDALTQWVPIEGKIYTIPGIPGITEDVELGRFPQMGAGENQAVLITYNGGAEYKPSSAQGTVTVNKANVSVKVNSTNIFAGDAIPDGFITTDPADKFDLYTIYAGITSNVTTGIYLDLPDRYTAEDSLILKLIDEALKAAGQKTLTEMLNDGVTVGELRNLFNTQGLLDLLDKLNIDTGTFGQIMAVINKLPGILDSVRISFGTPNRAGLYTVAVVTDSKNYNTGVGMGFLLVRMRLSGSNLVWADEIPNSKLTVGEAKNFNFDAILTYDGLPVDDQSSVHYLYSGFTSSWRIYSSTTTPPTEPGRYVVTVCILGGNYMAAPITRSFQITK